MYLGSSTAQAFTYKLIDCKKNKGSGECIDRLKIKTVNDVTEILEDQNHLLTFCLWYSYERSTINRPYIILLHRPI